jgi:small subunit ribosomal protein S9
MAKKIKKVDYIYAAGRRKSSSARVRLYRGKGVSTVNGKPIDKYFPGVMMKDKWAKPFKVLDVTDKYYVSAKVAGGGVQGQLDATVLGIAKAFAKVDVDKFRIPLKKARLLTRDARIRERRKVGMGGKARRKKQSPKR